MSANETDSNSSANTTKDSGTSALSTYNYSIDTMKKAAFTDELNSVLHLKKSVDFNPIIDYLNNRIDEINKRYK
jgi:hypothetical protein